MKASKFSEAQKAFILNQGADGVTVAEICRKAGISQATYFNWKKKFDGTPRPRVLLVPSATRVTDAAYATPALAKNKNATLAAPRLRRPKYIIP